MLDYLLAVLIGLFCLPTSLWAGNNCPDHSEMVNICEKNENAIVQVLDSRGGRCSGSIIRNNRNLYQVLTAKHCTGKGLTYTIHFISGKTCSAQFFSTSRGMGDVAYLSLDPACNIPAGEYFEFSSATVKQYTELVAYGFPRFNRAHGRLVRSYCRVMDKYRDKLSTNCLRPIPSSELPGASGGPVLVDGKVIGVICLSKEQPVDPQSIVATIASSIPRILVSPIVKLQGPWKKL
jgi:hypothetical protein